ncbi:ethanolamine ammonia-lyase subunit EutC [Marinobacter sp. F4206]|uniref:ethanolamine ammonia-lyase subunit EutC n=1 Tax=Marinobacter sp. F4206 TaxID=2861777 RepID=UPI001C5E928A|nr:ethanolamine ammonia-lyase subunit EutC [Marinobacter sp. F4206]MBW4935375.1 ethanolamine ammonia-lyase subunit EutC [Marinobacter sp. F4206]
MTDSRNDLVIDNAWRRLRHFTDARIGLGRAGISLPTSELLQFQLAHARARDAVHLPLDVPRLLADLDKSDLGAVAATPLVVHSEAEDRVTYLQRPDLGRRLSKAGRASVRAGKSTEPYDLALVIVDGLSSFGVQNNAVALVKQLLTDLNRDDRAWQLAPLTVVQQGRVAIGDEVGALLNARMVAVLIGERPGLSSPDSLGVYLTFGPEAGLTDARRNCISNIRPAGLGIGEASQRLFYLIREADRLKLSGVGLKDRTEDATIEGLGSGHNFLAN